MIGRLAINALDSGHEKAGSRLGLLRLRSVRRGRRGLGLKKIHSGGNVMNNLKGTNTDIESLIEDLASKDGMIRQKAREALVDLGNPAVSSLNHALLNSKLDRVRWEAAKALGGINDAGSIPSL